MVVYEQNWRGANVRRPDELMGRLHERLQPEENCVVVINGRKRIPAANYIANENGLLISRYFDVMPF